MERVQFEELEAQIRSLRQELASTRQILDAATEREAEHIRLQSELRHRSHVLDVVLSTLPDLICTFDLEGRFTYANSRFSVSGKSHLKKFSVRIPLISGTHPNSQRAFGTKSGL